MNQDAAEGEVRSDDANKERNTKKTVKKINDTLEKTTLGDLDVLANLKEEMEKANEGDK